MKLKCFSSMCSEILQFPASYPDKPPKKYVRATSRVFEHAPMFYSKNNAFLLMIIMEKITSFDILCILFY